MPGLEELHTFAPPKSYACDSMALTSLGWPLAPPAAGDKLTRRDLKHCARASRDLSPVASGSSFSIWIVGPSSTHTALEAHNPCQSAASTARASCGLQKQACHTPAHAGSWGRLESVRFLAASEGSWPASFRAATAMGISAAFIGNFFVCEICACPISHLLSVSSDFSCARPNVFYHRSRSTGA